MHLEKFSVALLYSTPPSDLLYNSLLRFSIESSTHDESKQKALLEEALLASKKMLNEHTWTVEDGPERRFRKMRDLIEAKKAARTQGLRPYDRKSACRLMTSEFFAFPKDMTIKDATKCIRNNPRIDLLKGIFILNAAGQLEGMVPARSMMIHPPTVELAQLMRPVLHKVTAESTRDEVIDLVEQYKIFSLPVVSEDNALIGVIDYGDTVEAIEEITDETFAHMAGTNETFTPQETVLGRFTSRAPWLVVTLVAGLINVAVMASFQQQEADIRSFAICFVPLITGLSGNIGIQCGTVLIRIMALGELTPNSRRGIISKEIISGLFTGTAFGIGCGMLVYGIDLLASGALATSSPLAVASIVSLGLIGACSAGTLLGVLSPLCFARLGVDPAIAAGPIVTAFNDFLSMVIYFLITCAVSQMF